MKAFLEKIRAALIRHYSVKIAARMCYVSDVNFGIRRSDSAPLWVNMVSHGDVIACDLTNKPANEDNILEVSFFWRERNSIDSPTDAKPVGYPFWLALQSKLPHGFSVVQYKNHGEFRIAKIYSRSCVTADDVAMEIAFVFRELSF